MAHLTLWHGSSHIIERPQHGLGNPNNDYGLGLYCTEAPELAKEWGSSEAADGFANRYALETDGLATLDLNGGGYTILHWLAVLIENRTFRVQGDAALTVRQYLHDTFRVDYSQADIMRGYRADDSYFAFAGAFLNNALSLDRLERAMTLGNLGEQVVVRSRRAFDRLRFEGAEAAPTAEYYPRKLARDMEARRMWREEVRGVDRGQTDAVYAMDIVREGWEADDARLRRIVSG